MTTEYEQWRKTNWDRAHKEGDISALTGTGLGGHLATLGCTELVYPETNVLCIGVGTGKWVHELVPKVTNTWALDTSSKAKDCLPPIVEFTEDAKQLPTDYFDLAMSLWVTPHMTDHDLECQLKEVIRSLKVGGILAIHYKEPISNETTIDNLQGSEREWRRASDAGMLRRRSYFEEMVTWSGGKVVKRVSENVSHFYSIIEVSTHITKE